MPGDQHAALRRAVREELKQRHGHSAKTFVSDDRVAISSNDTTEALRAEMAKRFHQAFNSNDHDAVPIDDSAWRFHWRTCEGGLASPQCLDRCDRLRSQCCGFWPICTILRGSHRGLAWRRHSNLLAFDGSGRPVLPGGGNRIDREDALSPNPVAMDPCHVVDGETVFGYV